MNDRVDFDDSTTRWKKRANLALIGFMLIAGYFLLTEHRAHLAGVVSYLPFLLLLACPLMHVFMHGSHGDHGKGKTNRPGTGSAEPADRSSAEGEWRSTSSSHHHHQG